MICWNASGGPITPFAGGGVGVCIGCTTVQLLTSALNGTYGTAADQLAAVAADHSAYGTLSSSASGSFNISGAATTTYTEAYASFTDLITVSYAPWNGSPGLMYYNYTLDGTVSSTGNGTAFAAVCDGGGPTSYPLSLACQDFTAPATSGTFSAQAIPFVYGQPFSLEFSLTTYAGAFQPETGSGSGIAMFFNTLVLSGLTPTDLSGVPAIGAQFSSASGTQYSIDGVIPEPSTGSLCVLGLIFASVVRALIGRGFRQTMLPVGDR